MFSGVLITICFLNIILAICSKLNKNFITDGLKMFLMAF